MNHHYPDNYHGYGHNAPGIPSMGYTGGYGDPATMARMVHPREGYQMPHYQMMQQPGGMYTQGGFIGPQSGNPYNMGGYGSYGMPGMNQSAVIGNRQTDMNRMSGGNMVNPYYSPGMPPDAHSSPHHAGMSSQSSTYSHSQANPHMQQPHMSMMSSPGHHGMPGQPSVTGQSIHGQGGQLSHSTGHSMSQSGPPQSSGAYGSQSSPHMIPRTHHVPQHPMRHPTTQQNPQEVADTILQMASSYPSNQTVQVPLKSRPAPYHIPRSPHYSVSHSDHPHTSPNPHLQPQPSPVASCQASPSPSSSSVKSPTPVLAPIPNPIPSPGISGLRSPCNQGMSPCGAQRSPAHMGSTYSGHSQGGPPTHCGSEGLTHHHGMSPSDSQHYSPCGLTPAHNFSPFSVSSSLQRNSSIYSPSCDASSISNQEHHQSSYSSPVSSSPCSSNLSPYTSTSKHMGQSTNSHHAVSALHMGNSPLMSLQKLVMLPETQVVDPKSVVNDTCLSSHQDESPKNVNGPAEWLAESSSHSVGFQGQSSSLRIHPQTNSHTFPIHSNFVNTIPSSNLCAPHSCSPEQKHPPCSADSNNRQLDELSRKLPQSNDDSNRSSVNHELGSQSVADKPVQHSSRDISHENIEAISNVMENSQQKLENTSPDYNISTLDNRTSDKVAPSLEDSKLFNQFELDKNTFKSLTPSPLLPVDGDTLNDIKALIGENIENTSETGSQPLHSLERKNGRVKEDPKCLIVQCHSPSVLVEMPVMGNGLSSTTCGDDDGIEQDCGNGVHTRIQNAFNSLVKAKFASVKKVAQFARVTPCSIAVGADERAACERFAFRRNGFCRTLRTSRMICNGRNRNDSTGNGDSDESLENMSENSFGLSESPQDGNRKRPASAAKRNDHKKPNLNSISATNQVAESDSKPAEPVAPGGNGCAPHGNEIISDDDTCYYEGVDSSDIFINNCSSDESVTSSGEANKNNASGAADEKQDSLLLTCDVQQDDQDEKSDKTDTESPSVSFDKKKPVSIPVPSSPPSKRLRRSSGQKVQEKLQALSTPKKCYFSGVKEIAEAVIDLTDDSMPEIGTPSSHNKPDPTASDSPMKNLREQNKSSSKFRPLILGHRPGGKYPVVVLEKSVVTSPAIKQENVEVDHTDLLEHSSVLKDIGVYPTAVVKNLTSENADTCDSKFKLENIDLDVKFHSVTKDSLIKTDPEEVLELKDHKPITPATHISSRSKVRKKKPPRRKTDKGKCKTKTPEKVSRDAEIRDSFKSMKFSRTLDLMKSRRRREQTSLGPFIRIVGKQSAPDAISVFTQPVHESSVSLTNWKHKHSKSRNAHPISTATTIHMVTNLPTDKAAMVSSSRTISHEPWVCAFCAHHSSYRFLGDLYGPYFKESEIPRVESIAAEESKKGEFVKDQKSSDSSTARKSKEPFPLERKSRRKGRSPLHSSETNCPLPEEVWFHEACVMWSPGVYLIGNKLYGLDEAIRDAAETVCSVCKLKGAMIGCLNKGCTMKYHFVCAIDKDCYMEEEKLSLLCPKHKIKRVKSCEESTRS